MKYIFSILASLSAVCGHAQQDFKFAFVSDTHVGSGTGEEDLRLTMHDINADTSLKFVVITGDITEFGSDHELQLAKSILDSFNKPWYIIPGNHDANWSESGSNSFKRIFGAETFSFTYGGYEFLGTASGPNMRMGPGQIPREQVNWLDSSLQHLPKKNMPVVFLNHYPIDSAMNNWFEVTDLLSKYNTQMIMCGHGHQNHRYMFEQFPGVMGRSNLRATAPAGGYNVVSFALGLASFTARNPVTGEMKLWTSVEMKDLRSGGAAVTGKNAVPAANVGGYYRPSYEVNKTFKGRVNWTFQDKFDIGSGSAVAADGSLLFTDTGGWIFALDEKTGKKKWAFRAGGKIYSTPAVGEKSIVVAGSSDNFIYALDLATGKLRWKFETGKAVLGSPVIVNDRVLIGGSDGHFRALALSDGKLIWDFPDVKGFVVTKPLLYNGLVYFGCWANDFYALDVLTGELKWTWNNGGSNRMFSPAACYPVATGNRVFIVAPDRYMTALDATTGKLIWRKQDQSIRVRESIGLALDSGAVLVKTMDGDLLGISTTADSMQVNWTSKLKLPYEICPTRIVQYGDAVYVPSNSGLVSAVSRSTGDVLWQYKTSNALVTDILPLTTGKVLVLTMDGKAVLLSPTYKKYTQSRSQTTRR